MFHISVKLKLTNSPCLWFSFPHRVEYMGRAYILLQDNLTEYLYQIKYLERKQKNLLEQLFLEFG